MKKLFTITIMLFVCAFSYGQELKELNAKYYLDLDKFEKGTGILEIKERVNYELFLEVEKDIQNHYNPPVERIKQARETLAYKPEKGNYFLKNEFQKFWFKMDDKGHFVGSAKAEITKKAKTYSMLFRFENGKAIETEIKDTSGKILSRFEVNDSVFIVNHFDKKGNLKQKFMVKNNGGRENSIETTYYENGKTKSIVDRINNTFKSFYETGTLQSFKNENNSEAIDYDEKGRKTYHSYPAKDIGWCQEYFENGLITGKKCNTSDHLQQTQYYYKNGKIDYYEIEDRTKGEIKQYDKNNKLISTRQATYPSVAPAPKKIDN